MREILTTFLPIILSVLFVVVIGWVVWRFFSLKDRLVAQIMSEREQHAEIVRKMVATPESNFYIAQSEHVEWLPENLQELRKFYGTECGQKLIKICGSHIIITAKKECAGDSATPAAYGMDELLKFQFNLASEQMLKSISPPPASQEEHTVDAQREQSVPIEYPRAF